MKRILLAFCVGFMCVCSCAFADVNDDLKNAHTVSEVQKALDNGATNIDSVFSHKLNLTYCWDDADNAKILIFLNSKGAKTTANDLDSFYYNYIREFCLWGKVKQSKQEFFDSLSDKRSNIKLNGDKRSSSRYYRPDDSAVRHVYDMVAFSSERDANKIACMLIKAIPQGKSYDKKMEYLDYGMERAVNYNNQQMIDFLNLLKQEIENQTLNSDK